MATKKPATKKTTTKKPVVKESTVNICAISGAEIPEGNLIELSLTNEEGEDAGVTTVDANSVLSILDTYEPLLRFISTGPLFDRMVVLRKEVQANIAGKNEGVESAINMIKSKAQELGSTAEIEAILQALAPPKPEEE